MGRVRGTSARLILVNGMPGVGKSTLAARYRDQHPGVLCLESDVLRRWIGGDPAEHAEAARHLSLALAGAHLATGHDVVVPQLVARLDQLERFEYVAAEAGAELVEILLVDDAVESRVPDEALPHLLEYADGLADLLGRRPRTQLVRGAAGDVDVGYEGLCALLR